MPNKSFISRWLVAAAVFFTPFEGAIGATTLERIKERGYLLCGVSEGIPGFSYKSTGGQWKGLDTDMCRAVAAAVLGDASKIKYISLSPEQRFNALTGKEIDLLVRGTTLMLSREAEMPVEQAVIHYHDGQGFLVHKESSILLPKQLEGTRICVTRGTSAAKNLKEFLDSSNIKAEIVYFGDIGSILSSLEERKCDAYTTEKSILAGRRQMLSTPEDYRILADTISRDPLGIWVHQDDPAWSRLIYWIFQSLVTAEYLGITSANADTIRKTSNNPEIRDFLDENLNFPERLGISRNWTYNVVKAVGNYGEIFDRNLGIHSNLRIGRGLNQIWTKGGLFMAIKFR